MNQNLFFKNVALAVAIALAFCGLNSVLAGDTNAPATNGIAANAGAQNYYGLPKEAFERLTPDQIMELAQSHQKTFVTEQLPDTILTILVPIALFTFIGVCVALGVNGRLKRQRLLHDTLRMMIEKGQPIPPELLTSPEKTKQPRNDLLYGLIFSGIGLALMVFFFTIANGFKGPWAIGLIPLFIGIAFFIVRKLEGNGPSK